MRIRPGTKKRLLEEIAELIAEQKADAIDRLKEVKGEVSRWEFTSPERELERMRRDEGMRHYVSISDISDFPLRDLFDSNIFLVTDDVSEYFGKIGVNDGRYKLMIKGRRIDAELDKSQVYEAVNVGVIVEEYGKRFGTNGQINLF